MRLDHIVAAAVDHLVGRMLRHAVLALAIAAFAIVAIYQFTVAGTLALDMQYGELHARLIVGAIYTAAAAIVFAILWAMRSTAANASVPALGSPQGMQVAMLVEAAMLGYALARKGERAR